MAQKVFLQSDNLVKDPAAAGVRAAPRGGRKESQEAKKLFLKALQKGATVRDALIHVGRTENTYPYWRKSDPKFREAADHIIGLRRRKAGDRKAVPDFPEFCSKYLGWDLFRHQLQWIDILEGREPRELHPAQTYEPGRRTHLIINTPPFHAKSTTISVAYVLWTILRDPNSLVILISKSQDFAADFIAQIQELLTNPDLSALQTDFGPPGGFKANCTEWSRTRIRFGPEIRDKTAKDPTVQAVGLRGQIYGKRATLIVADDVVDTENVQEYDKQFNWLTRMVANRIGDAGRFLVIGTRVGQVDLYKELRNPERYEDGDPGWSYFAQPAVEEFDEDPEKWQTLWPYSNEPQVGDLPNLLPNGMYEMWTGPRLKKMRALVGANAWIQGYQQGDLKETAVFPQADVYGCVNKMRHPGLLIPGAPGHREKGMAGLYVIAGLDPASEGHTAAVAYAIDLETHKRYVLKCHNQANMTPDEVRALIKDWTENLGVKEWRIEKVLLSSWIQQDREIIEYTTNRGCVLAPHQTTGKTKWDADAGVMGMAGLFKGSAAGKNMIELPRTESEAARALVQQLITYFPKTKAKTDLLMALWFAEVRARQLATETSEELFVRSEYTTRRGLLGRRVIDLSEASEEDLKELDYVWS